MTQVFHDVSEWQRFRRDLPGEQKPEGVGIGFVPTMGALHEGHASLIQRAKRENSKVVVSIFVNPTQFDNPQDLQTYPQTWHDDLKVLEAMEVDYVLAPPYEQLYPDDYRYRITESDLSHRWCGAHRPGHFDGVLTVVIKLLNLTQADRAYFGEKDYQQYLLIKGMVEAFFMATQIIPCPTVRESDGLAMSSRNRRLNSMARKKAPLLAQILSSATSSEKAFNQLTRAGFTVDYVDDFLGRRFAAAHIDNVRLIDNVKL